MTDDTAIAELAKLIEHDLQYPRESAAEIARRIHAAGYRRPGPASPNDVGKVAVALSLFASALMSGEPWSEACGLASKEAHDALMRLSGAVRFGSITDAQVEAGAVALMTEENMRRMEGDRWRGPQTHHRVSARAVLEAAAVPAAPEWRATPVAQWVTKVDQPVLIYVVDTNAEFEKDEKRRKEMWEGWFVGRWIDHNHGGWMWHGMLGTVTHVAPLLMPPPPVSP